MHQTQALDAQAIPLNSSWEASQMREVFISQMSQRLTPPPPNVDKNLEYSIAQSVLHAPLVLQDDNDCYLKETGKGEKGIPGHWSLETADLINAGFLGAFQMLMCTMNHQEKMHYTGFPRVS